MDCMTCLYTCLYDRFEALRDEPPSVGCTCPKGSFGSLGNGQLILYKFDEAGLVPSLG
jgi:hypothetical protein